MLCGIFAGEVVGQSTQPDADQSVRLYRLRGQRAGGVFDLPRGGDGGDQGGVYRQMLYHDFWRSVCERLQQCETAKEIISVSGRRQYARAGVYHDLRETFPVLQFDRI